LEVGTVQKAEFCNQNNVRIKYYKVTNYTSKVTVAGRQFQRITISPQKVKFFFENSKKIENLNLNLNLKSKKI
jgi:hypothetical protein